MAQFGFENDIHSILKLDMPITNAPMARWQRKASSSNTSALNGLSPGKIANVSLSSSKTPSKTPGKSKKQTPSKMGGDRFIPTRNSKQMDVASFLLTKENEPMDTNNAAGTSESQKAWSMTLNGYNIEDAKILHLGGKPLNAPEGYQNNLKVLYSQVTTPASTKKTRYISSTPDRILDAPHLRNDFYLNLLDWSSRNVLAVALHDSVYLWDATQGDIILLMNLESEEDYICSLSWTKEGSYLAIGTSDCKVQLWDVENQKRLRSMASHTARVGSLSWNDHILSSGSRSGHIHHHDVRVADHHIATLTGHSQEVCGLKWSPDGRYLASGGNDNLVCVWPRVQEGNNSQSVRCWSEHQGAVKALAWCPWQPNILATGGGTSDRHIRIWNVNSGSCLTSLDTQSQISSLGFAPNYKELVSAHGYAHNNVTIWKYPSLTRVAELNGHEDRVLSLTLSPDGSTVATVAGDETIRLWKSFEMDPVKKKAKERALAWCPWQPDILASGGSNSDRHIRIWNVNSDSCLTSLDTQSQISSLVFAPNYKELVSAHGHAHNNVTIWKYPSLTRVAELKGHENRVLSLTLTPDGSTVATVAGDEIRLWKSFEVDPYTKKDPVQKAKERVATSGIHRSIR